MQMNQLATVLYYGAAGLLIYHIYHIFYMFCIYHDNNELLPTHQCAVCGKPMGDLLDSMFIHGGKVNCESCYSRAFD